jgi:hypothetical protein
MGAPELSPHDVHLKPELTALAILDAALMASRAALIAAHPNAGHRRGRHCPAPSPPLIGIATLLLERTAELRRLLTRYGRALDNSRPDHDDGQTEFPF